MNVDEDGMTRDLSFSKAGILVEHAHINDRLDFSRYSHSHAQRNLSSNFQDMLAKSFPFVSLRNAHDVVQTV